MRSCIRNKDETSISQRFVSIKLINLCVVCGIFIRFFYGQSAYCIPLLLSVKGTCTNIHSLRTQV